MGIVKAYYMMASDAISVAIKDEDTILKQRIIIAILSIICGLLAVKKHGKKHS